MQTPEEKSFYPGTTLEAPAAPQATAQRSKSFLVLFFKKELLPSAFLIYVACPDARMRVKILQHPSRRSLN
jgi:hypothetical protein